MLFVNIPHITNPRMNLAIEEYLLRHVKIEAPLLLFYINEPSVIIGRNQNTLEEVDRDYIEANGVHVVRRLSGGGAVYHDLGNLNFSFITNSRDDLQNFAKFVEPVTAVLQELGVPAELKNKSDIFVAGKKVSGNAQFSSGGRMFSHGTILFDSNLQNLLQAINPTKREIESNAVQSIRNFVTNVREHLPADMTIMALKEALLQGIFGGGVIPEYKLWAEDWQMIEQISSERYQTWEWNIGRAPQFNIQKVERLSVGKVDVRINVAKGVIVQIAFYGDFSGVLPISALSEWLVGVRYDARPLREALQDVDLTLYFGPIDREEFLKLIY